MNTREIILSIAVVLLLFSCKDIVQYEHDIKIKLYYTDGYSEIREVGFYSDSNAYYTLREYMTKNTYYLIDDYTLNETLPHFEQVENYRIISYEITRIEQ